MNIISFWYLMIQSKVALSLTISTSVLKLLDNRLLGGFAL